jgi:hypothetical protein
VKKPGGPGIGPLPADGEELSHSNTVIAVPETQTISLTRRIFSFPAVLAGSLVFLVFIFARRDIADPDLWWHLRNAQWLLTQGHLPAADHYSFTVPGAAILPFEWLSELPFYAAFRLAGLTGLFWLVFALSAAILLGVFRLSYLASRDVKNSFLVSVGGAVLAAITIGSRPLLFGWLYLVILLLVLAEAREGRRRWLWLLPPLFCLWINSHGSWPMGLVIFGIFIASGLVEGRWGNAYATRWSGVELRRLLAVAMASVAALFVNPAGHRLVLYAFQAMFGKHASIGAVDEFASVDFHTPWGKVAMVLILGTLLIALFSREPWRLDEIAITLVALYWALTYSRFLFLAGILLPPVFARRVKLMTPYERNSDKALPNVLALLVLLCSFIIAMPRNSNFQEPVPYPAGAVAYMKSHGMAGRVFPDYVWGGYLIWHAPESKVFIDGRWDPYAPSGVAEDYRAAIFGENSQAVLDKYRVEYVLMPADSLLVRLLRSSPAWTVLYEDKTSVLLVRSPVS